MSGALCREQVKEKPSEKESGDFPLQSLLPLAEEAKNSRAQMNSSMLEERLTHAIIQKHPNTYHSTKKCLTGYLNKFVALLSLSLPSKTPSLILFSTAYMSGSKKRWILVYF